MADQKTSDTEFDDYLKGESALSDLYHQSETNGPGKDIDNAILSAAHQEVKQTSSGSSSKTYRWYVPLALAASLIIAVFAIRIIPLDNSLDPDQIAENGQQANTGQHVGSGKAAPDVMLEKINELVVSGNKDEAQQEIELFVELFPDYKIDFSKYPALKELSIE